MKRKKRLAKQLSKLQLAKLAKKNAAHILRLSAELRQARADRDAFHLGWSEVAQCMNAAIDAYRRARQAIGKTPLPRKSTRRI